MRRIVKLFPIAAVAVFAFTAFAATTALAEVTKILPEPTAGAPLTDQSISTTRAVLLTVGGFQVTCEQATGIESWTSANNGKWELTYKGCKGPLATKCKGAGEPEEVIELKGEARFWLALQMEAGGASSLIAALVFLIKPAVDITCAKVPINELLVVQENSCVAAKDLNINSLISTNHEEFAEWTSGETSILSVLPAGSSSEIWCLPTSRLNAAATELFALAGLGETDRFRKSEMNITIELMN